MVNLFYFVFVFLLFVIYKEIGSTQTPLSLLVLADEQCSLKT